MAAVTRLLGAFVAAAVVVTAAGAAEQPTLRFRVFADTGIRLTDVLWTGSRFLYVENTTNTVYSAGPTGTPLTGFAQMPRKVEETRCRLSSGTHGFPAGYIYCHAPDNTIYRLSPDGSEVTKFAQLPDSSVADGALSFDTVGKFGFALIAATGRSGKTKPGGGKVYAIQANGDVRKIGTYPGPGGADEVVVTPKTFGTAPGEVAIAVDAGVTGSLVLMDRTGRTRVIARLSDGPNPIVVVEAPPQNRRATPPPGVYVTDTLSHHIFYAPASALRRFVGKLLVGSELKGRFWTVQPHGRGFRTTQLRAILPGGSRLNLEGATYVAG